MIGAGLSKALPRFLLKCLMPPIESKIGLAWFHPLCSECCSLKRIDKLTANLIELADAPQRVKWVNAVIEFIVDEFFHQPLGDE